MQILGGRLWMVWRNQNISSFLHPAVRYGHWVSVLKFPQKILPLGTITSDLCILSGFKTTLPELLTFQRKKVFMRPSRHVIPKCLSTKNYWKLLQQGGGTNIKTIHTYYDELGISLCIWVTSLPIVRTFMIMSSSWTIISYWIRTLPPPPPGLNALFLKVI